MLSDTCTLRETPSHHEVLQYSPNVCDLGKAFTEETPSVNDYSPSSSLVPLCMASSFKDERSTCEFE